MEDETVKEITNETETVRRRSIGLAILFSIITFGVYYLYWFVKVTTDSNRIGDIKTANGFLSLVFVLPFYFMDTLLEGNIKAYELI